MDANRLRFWMLADESHWQLRAESPGGWLPGPEDSLSAYYDGERRRLGLVSERELPPPPGDMDALRVRANELLARVPGACDQFGTRAFWDAELGLVVCAGALPDPLTLYWPGPDTELTDIALGYDGILYMAISGAVTLYDLRDRWEPVTVSLAGFVAWRLTAAADGGIWALDQENRQIARLRGAPLPARPYGIVAPGISRPCEENRDPPRLELLERATWPAEERAVALAGSPGGHLALLTWPGDNDAHLSILGSDLAFAAPLVCERARFPYSLAWIGEELLALLLPYIPEEAPVFDLRGAHGSVRPVGDFYPLRDHDGGPFCHGVTQPPRYPIPAGTQPLHHLSLPAYRDGGRAIGRRPFDSGSAATIWHRIYLEAIIPDHCGIRVLLAANDSLTPPHDSVEWYEHRFGMSLSADTSTGWDRFGPVINDTAHGLPRAAWMSYPSELPHHPGMLGCDQRRDRIGLFTVLIQRATRQVRTLRGRFLHIRIELLGDGRTTPEIAALRAYGSRFSYVENYLPELYREQLFGPDADATVTLGMAQNTTTADFLERFLDNFEGMLTPLEDRIAAAHLLTDARTVPTAALEWLGSWIGVSFDPLYPPERRRLLLQGAPAIFRWRGTVRGLSLALDIATDGAVERGHIVVLEDFRLRRTFATILGADLADEQDPLLAGVVRSGNSFVGDTLFLGDEHRNEFLALFSPELPDSAGEQAIRNFFEQLAHRVTVLVHRDALQDELPLIRRIMGLETPAHIVARILPASDSFIVGVAALVGVDSYLGRKPQPRPASINRSLIGVRDRVMRLPALDPRLEGGVAPRNRLPPRAVANGPVEAEIGTSFNLDARGSQAAPGRAIKRYIWRYVDPNNLEEPF
jgi:phage tail-like protein